jgi:hypothetical protein
MRDGAGRSRVIAGVTMLCLLYVFSPVPLDRMISELGLDGPASQVDELIWFPYTPIIWLYQNVPLVEHFYDWQIDQLDAWLG